MSADDLKLFFDVMSGLVRVGVCRVTFTYGPWRWETYIPNTSVYTPQTHHQCLGSVGQNLCSAEAVDAIGEMFKK